MPPLKVIYLFTDNLYDIPVKAGFVVTKKYFKRAVDRNRIKRLIRETYRLQKHLIATNKENSLLLFIMYTGKQLPEYSLIEKQMADVISKLNALIKNRT
ncbi:hypothetical protein BH09BAC2_BH09BAC2_01130 [soil metagenome]